MKPYNSIVEHYENCLAEFGDTHKGVDWPNEADMYKRYRIMLDIHQYDIDAPAGTVSILDFGCGTAGLKNYLDKNEYKNWIYKGLDISEKFIEVCRKKYPAVDFFCLDILAEDISMDQVDYIIMNGVFTEKREMSFEEMLDYFKKMMRKVFPLARRGVAFNVMSTNVDWERQDLFHLSMDKLAEFVSKELGRKFVIRNDYGLYEYSVYIFH